MRLGVCIVSVLFIFSLLTGISFAQNKVVVIPLIEDCSQIPTVKSKTGRVWMDRNLGAFRVAKSIDDYQAYGWLYQWGRLADGHELPYSETTDTLSVGDVPDDWRFIINSDWPYNWSTTLNGSLWQGVSGKNNPCPAGFRLPTQEEWQKEINSWKSKTPAGAFSSPLRLVLAGGRNYEDGIHEYMEVEGYYSSSTLTGTATVASLKMSVFSQSVYMLENDYRAYGNCVRCIKD